MQVAIFDYFGPTITIFTLPEDIAKMALDPDEDFDLGEYIESLPGYDPTYCYWMTGAGDDDIKLRIGKQEDFPEFNLTSTNE